MQLELKLVTEPHELLHRAVKPFDFNEYDIDDVERQMVDIMIKNHGIGLAANQVGLDAAVFVWGSYNIKEFPNPHPIVNPRIIEVSDTKILDREGCLSFPNLWLNVVRPEWIIVEYQNRKAEFERIKVDGYLAKCFQHEFDHLHGICYTDRVGKAKLNLALRKQRNLNGRTQQRTPASV